MTDILQYYNKFDVLSLCKIHSMGLYTNIQATHSTRRSGKFLSLPSSGAFAWGCVASRSRRCADSSEFALRLRTFLNNNERLLIFMPCVHIATKSLQLMPSGQPIAGIPTAIRRKFTYMYRSLYGSSLVSECCEE